MESLRDVDSCDDLAPFLGEDKRQLCQILEMEKKFTNITKIFSDIQEAPEEKKFDVFVNHQPTMERISLEVQAQHKHMTNQAN
jgi:hypothetical protein